MTTTAILRVLGVLCGGLGLASPAAAQSLSIRPFGMATIEQFAAQTSFDTVLGDVSNGSVVKSGSLQPFFGGGADIILPRNIYVDVTASRFQKDGQRAFIANGQTFQLGIPLSVSLIAFEVTGGYRFKLTRYKRIVPYVGVGVGVYSYKETSPDPADTLSASNAGGLLVGGVEFRVHRWVGLSIDAQLTRVPGILGTAGVSKDANETDLGGVSGRVRVIVGK